MALPLHVPRTISLDEILPVAAVAEAVVWLLIAGYAYYQAAAVEPAAGTAR